MCRNVNNNNNSYNEFVKSLPTFTVEAHKWIVEVNAHILKRLVTVKIFKTSCG